MNTGKTTQAKKSRRRSTRNSSSGMTSIEVCRIIKACKENKVSIFEYSGLKLRFNVDEQEDYTANNQFVQYPIEQTGKLGDNNIEHYDYNEEDEFVERDLEELKISNPLEYEKILQRGEI